MKNEIVVTYNNVLEAYKAIKQEGKKPSTRSIHAKLGSGNCGHIGKFLKQIIEEEEVANEMSSAQADDQYKELIAVVITAIKKIVTDKTKEIESEKTIIAEELDEYETKIITWDQELASLNGTILEKDDEIKNLLAEKKALYNQINEMKVIFDDQLKEFRNNFQAQLQEKNEALSNLHLEKEELREKLSEALSIATKDASYYKGLHEGSIVKVPTPQKIVKSTKK
jgi:chromosome segregation ATPase